MPFYDVLRLPAYMPCPATSPSLRQTDQTFKKPPPVDIYLGSFQNVNSYKKGSYKWIT